MAAFGGFNAKAGIGTADPVDLPLDFISENLACNESFIYRGGIRGSRSHPVEVVRQGLRRIEGQMTLQPTINEWNSILGWILGGSPTVGTPTGKTTFPLAETVPERYVGIAREDGTDGKYFLYNGVKVDTCTIRATQGELLTCVLDLVGKDEAVGNAGSGPSLTVDISTAPLTFTDGVVSIASTAYSIKSIEIQIKNMLDRERFFNSNTRTAIVAQDREILVNMELGYGESEAVYATGTAGVAVSAVFTNGNYSLDMSFVKVCFPRTSPTVQGKQEVMLPLRGRALKSSTTAELVTILDLTG